MYSWYTLREPQQGTQNLLEFSVNSLVQCSKCRAHSCRLITAAENTLTVSGVLKRFYILTPAHNHVILPTTCTYINGHFLSLTIFFGWYKCKTSTLHIWRQYFKRMLRNNLLHKRQWMFTDGNYAELENGLTYPKKNSMINTLAWCYVKIWYKISLH